MATRKAPRIAGRIAGNARRKNLPRDVEAIISRRQQRIDDVTFLRERGASSKLIDNAQQLLTRWWSTADWKSRGELLKTAEWLVRLETRRSTDDQVPA